MISPSIPKNEKKRLQSLMSFNILDTIPEKDLDDLTQLAGIICNTPIALISLIDQKRQWFKSHIGLDVTETPREFAFCAHAIVYHEDLLIVNDARKDERFFDNPLVINQPNVIFYAGHVLRSKEGYRLGTLCVIDNKPKQLSETQVNSLRIIANQIMHLLELKKTKAELKKINNRLEEKNINIENHSFQINTNLKELMEQKKFNDNILYNMLPEEVTIELKNTGTYKPKAFSSVSILITDFKDFTRMSENISAELLVDELNYCFSKFDEIISKYNIEKIKTIGDSYFCVSGMPTLSHSHAINIVNAAMELNQFITDRRKEKEEKGEVGFEMRIGVHTGPVVAGVVGTNKFLYDVWGESVNIASRMESSCILGNINISESTFKLIEDKFNCTCRGNIATKGKKKMKMYFVDSKK